MQQQPRIEFQRSRDPKVIHASELGSCIAALVRRRLGYKEALAPKEFIGPDGYFERGHDHEARCLEALKAGGWTIKETQREIHSLIGKDSTILGHIDAFGLQPGRQISRDAELIEIKSPKSWEAFRALWNGPTRWDEWTDSLARRYAWQVSAYMHMTGLACNVVCLKDDGSLGVFRIMVAPVTYDEMKVKVGLIESCAEAKAVPACNQQDYPCPFYPFHEKKEEKDKVPLEARGAAHILAGLKLAVDMRKASEEAEKALRAELRALIGDEPGIYSTLDADVELYAVKGRTTYDYAAMEADGVALTKYRVDGEGRVQMKVTFNDPDTGEES